MALKGGPRRCARAGTRQRPAAVAAAPATGKVLWIEHRLLPTFSQFHCHVGPWAVVPVPASRCCGRRPMSRGPSRAATGRWTGHTTAAGKAGNCGPTAGPRESGIDAGGGGGAGHGHTAEPQQRGPRLRAGSGPRAGAWEGTR